MALSQQTSRQPSSHYASQAGLAVAFAGIIKAHWPNLDRAQLYALLIQFSRASSVIAARDYSARRVEAGIRSQFTVPHAAPPSLEQFDKTLNWVFAAPKTDPAAVEQRAEAALTRLAVQGGRETTVEAVQADPKARAWARETRPGCCSFCAMIATRGAVYKSEGAAGGNANDRFTGAGEFKYHNNCHCIAVPVFGAYEATAQVRQWQADWRSLRGRLGDQTPSLNQWRQHFEGRPIDGLDQ